MIKWLIPLCAVTAAACSSAQESAVDCLGRPMAAAELNGTAHLSWTAPDTRSDGSPFDDLSGYWIYYGVDRGALSCRIAIDDAKATRWVVTALPPGVWHFAVVSIDAEGVESEPSDIVTKRID